ncbi:hypothetical protein MON38_07955 [Hymenobacter sp. DH14]|uniref:Uncharacterized protein n=1 Tax=Hymenobacter cyanobacteriorum TaxID=2926463 RepID=A0A9X1VEZ2_9BACT|nr:hypothetical protein [Hymenobacter cyanobacteriorum]MCI1187350.1 hypothetical protein [Hymenobacter cyanobacteriorum]
METLPLVLPLAFILTTALAVGLFYTAARRSGRVLAVLLGWLLLQGGIGLSGFYTVSNTMPPRLALLLGPPLLAIALLLATRAGRRFLDGLRLEVLTLLHIVRVPVELVLFGLYLHHAVPRLMTFEGRNLDILAGLTAPVIYFLAFRQQWLGRRGLLVWNVLGLISLLNIVVNAVLSVPTPVQQFGFEQPNVAILHFPFVWLPGVVVPLVLLAHVTAIRRLWASHAELAQASAGAKLP